MPYPTRAGRLLVTGIGVLFTLACSKPASDGADPVPGPPPPASITIVAGDAQSAIVEAELPQSLVLGVWDADGLPVEGVVVDFAVTTGSAILSWEQATTDGAGLASVTVELGNDPGTITIGATTGLSLAGEPLNFTATAQPRPPTSMTFGSGAGQSGSVGDPLDAPFVVKIANSVGGPVSGIPVTFTITSGSGSLSAGIASTNGSGLASVLLTLPTVPGAVTVAASTGLGLSGEPVAFVATANPGDPAALVFLASPSSAAPSKTISPVVKVGLLDAYGNVCTSSSDPVTIAITEGSGTAGAGLAGTPVKGAVAGVASFDDLSIDLEGEAYALTASVPALAPVESSPFDVTLESVLAFGVEPSLTEQEGVTWGYFSVELRDAAGVLRSGDSSSVVTLSLVSGAGVLTGTLSRTANGGSCVFDDLAFDETGPVTIKAESVAAPLALTATITVESGPASGLPLYVADASSIGATGNDGAADVVLSGDGRYIAFASEATNLVSGDTNAMLDVFVHDRKSGETTRVSVGPGGVQANGASRHVSISAGGRYVAYRSDASNLVAGDTNGVRDIFVHDRRTGTTRRVNLGVAGVQSTSASQWTSISSSGRAVAFQSSSPNLVAGDTNGVVDVFVRDLAIGMTSRVSVGTGGVQAAGVSQEPRISGDGRCVAFESSASNLVAGDSNGEADVFLHDRSTGLTERVSVTSEAGQAGGASENCSISSDGRYVAFQSTAANLAPGKVAFYDVFVRDRETGVTERVSNSLAVAGLGGDFQSESPSISADGRHVAFYSKAGDLVTGDENLAFDAFVHDRLDGVTLRANEKPAGYTAGEAIFPAISADGRYVAFISGEALLPVYPAFHSYVVPIP